MHESVSLQAVCHIADSYARLYRLTLGLLLLVISKHLWALYIQSKVGTQPVPVGTRRASVAVGALDFVPTPNTEFCRQGAKCSTCEFPNAQLVQCWGLIHGVAWASRLGGAVKCGVG